MSGRAYWLTVMLAYFLVEPFLEDESLKGRYKDIPIDICLHLRHGAITYRGEWAVPLIGNYPDGVKDAITKYLDSAPVADIYGPKINECYEWFNERVPHQERRGTLGGIPKVESQ